MLNYYKVLGVHKRTTEEELHERYKKLAWEHHPDHGGDAAVFAAINQAYATLRSKQARARYEAEFKLYHDICGTCSGGGTTRIARGFTSVRYTACTACSGCGYVIRERSRNVIQSAPLQPAKKGRRK